MSKPVELSNDEVLTAVEGAKQIEGREKTYPGLFTLKLSRIMSKVRKEAKLISERRDLDLADHTKYAPQENEDDEKVPMPVIDEATGKAIPNTVQLVDPKVFRAKEKALLEGKVTLTVPLFTEDEFKGLSLPFKFTEAMLPFIEGA